MPVQLKDLQDRTKYRKALKEELTTLKPAPSVFTYFEKFKFSDDRIGPLLLVGDLMRKDLFESVKNTDAPIKAKGKCAKAGEQAQFLVEMGTLPLDKLTADLGGVAVAEVKKIGVAPEAPADAALKGAAEAKQALLVKQFDAIKARMTDDERKGVREEMGAVVAAMEAGRHGEAIEAMKRAERKIAGVGNLLRQDAENRAQKGFDEAAKTALAQIKQVTDTDAQVKKLIEDIKSTEQKAGAAGSKKSKQQQENAARLRTEAEELKKKLEAAKLSLAEAQKARDADPDAVKRMAAQLLAVQATYKLATETLEAPGKLADDPELLANQEALKGKVGEMAAAVKFQQEQVKGSGHGTGRHGAQTGIEGQAQRVASDVTPDQAHNPGGTASMTAQWKTTIKWKQVDGPGGKKVDEKDAQGKRIVDKPAQIVQTVIDEVSNTFAAQTASMFLNPVLEHEAVTRALEIAEQCKWTEWLDGGTWRELLSLTVVVPPPRTAKGYGLAVGRADGFVKQAAATAAGHVKDFETGKIKTIEELMDKLDVEIKKDRTGEGAALVKHARVVLERTSVASTTWKAKTHFPTDDPPGWDCAKGKPLTGKTVRIGAGAPSVAPDYTR